jgi:hypothetical protein
MTTPWASLGTLGQYIDFTSILTFGRSYVDYTVITAFLTGQLGAATWVYTADLMALVAAFVGSAYIIIKTVDSGVSMTRGYYAVFAGGSNFANALLTYEIIIIVLWELFALTMALSGLYDAYNVWGAMDARLAEAAEGSIGLENAFTWEKAIKASSLLMVIALADIISGFTLGDIADEVVTWFGEYDNDTKSEGRDKKDGDYDADGTSAETDIYIHMGTTLYGFIALAAISIGGNWFTY